MIYACTSRRAVRLFLRGAVFALLLAGSGLARSESPEPLARYIPAEGLTALVEHNGLAVHPKAWKATAAYKMLNETSLGAMLEDIMAQLADRALQTTHDPVTGKELVELLEHLAARGFAVGYFHNPQPPQPKAVILVIRDAAESDLIRKLIGRMPPLNEPRAQQKVSPAGRKYWSTDEKDKHVCWWFENRDLVLSFAPDSDDNLIAETLEGKRPSAMKSPAYAGLDQLEAGIVPIGRFFVDLSVLPPLPLRAKELGLDGVRRVQGRWGIQEKSTVITLGVDAPRPRRGVLALFDHPPIKPGTHVVTPEGSADYTLLSVEPGRLAEMILTLVRDEDPDSAARITAFAQRFRERTGLSLRDDLLAKIGPRMALIPSGSGIGSALSFWMHPPDLALVAELKDAKGFADTLDRLIESANRELKAAGAMVSPQPGQPNRPGTEFAEFRRLKGPEHGYVLAVPPSVLPTPAGLRPTVIVEPGRGLLVLAGSPASARRASSSLVLDGPAGGSPWDRDAIIASRSDPRRSLPELLTSLPSLIQFIGFSATQQPGFVANPGFSRAPAATPFRLQIDPDAIPDPEQIRPYLFPSRFSLAVNDSLIRMTSVQAFPVPMPSLDVGMETPVLIALLLPAVQSAREAARRAQCTNNLKQIGLAFHNYADVKNGFPAAAITSRDGKPLLSWRVAILPYLEQQPLYEKFKLDEPWDSPHNKELIKYMPQVYACPSRNLAGEPGMTSYRVFTGKGALLEPSQATKLVDVTDGMSNTFMVVEAKQAVPWTKPDELPFDADVAAHQPAPLFGAGSSHPGGFNSLLADGSVRFIKQTINLLTLRTLITKAGGEVVDVNSY